MFCVSSSIDGFVKNPEGLKSKIVQHVSTFGTLLIVFETVNIYLAMSIYLIYEQEWTYREGAMSKYTALVRVKVARIPYLLS